MAELNFDLLDPGAHYCPICGEPRGVCACDEADFMAEAADDWIDDDIDWDEDDYDEDGEPWIAWGE